MAVWLVIAGGDVHEVHAIHHAFSLLNVPENQTNIKFNDDGEMNFFISKLMNNIIIIKPTFKMLSDEELVYENYYSGLLIHFSCRTRNLILFIRWKLSNVEVDIAYLRINLYQKKHVQWCMREENIKRLHSLHSNDHRKIERLKESLALIPSDPILTW